MLRSGDIFEIADCDTGDARRRWTTLEATNRQEDRQTIRQEGRRGTRSRSLISLALVVFTTLGSGTACLVDAEDYPGWSEPTKSDADGPDKGDNAEPTADTNSLGDSGQPQPTGDNKGSEEKGDEGKSVGSDDEKDELKPTKLELVLRLNGELSSSSKLRLHFQIAKEEKGTLKAGKSIYDGKAKLEGDRIKVEVPPPNAKLLKDGRATILTTLYKDRDKNESPGKKDDFIATLPGMILYQRPEEKRDEWQFHPNKEDKAQAIKGALTLSRVDEIEPNRQALLAGKRSKVDRGIKAVASVTVKEYKNLASKYSKVPQVVDGVLPKDGSLWRVAVGRPMESERIEEGGSVFEGFSTNALAWLVGHDGNGRDDLKISAKAKIAAGVCRDDEPVVLIWMDDDDWIQTPEATFLAVRLGLTPGWNVVAVKEDKDKRRRFEVLSEREKGELRIRKDCMVDDPVRDSE